MRSSRNGRVTIRDVAELAGVSIATVSRVANGRTDVAIETRHTVERVIREHGYRGSRPVRVAPTGLIGIAIPLVQPTYFADILSGATEALYERGMRPVLCQTRHSHDRETSLVERLADGETDGAIIVLPEESAAELQALGSHGFRYVVVDPRAAIGGGVPVIAAAHSSGAMQATAHLLELGHRRIGAITGPVGWMATEERLRGYQGALAGAGLLPDPDLVAHADFEIEGGRIAAADLLARPDPPTAVFAFNDTMAIGVLRAASARGLRVPADLSVVGFDDTAEATITVPPLTTVRQPLAEMGRTAVSLLLRQLHNRRLEPLRVELETRLVVRDSTAAPAAVRSVR